MKTSMVTTSARPVTVASAVKAVRRCVLRATAFSRTALAPNATPNYRLRSVPNPPSTPSV